MKAITVWQPWASLIANECKIFEFRKWAAPRKLVNTRIAIHAGARKVERDEIIDLISKVEADERLTALSKKAQTLDYLEKLLVSPGMAPRSAIVCTAILGRPQRCTELFKGKVADSSRIDHHMWAWPMLKVERLEPPEPATGSQGFWTWNPPGTLL